MDKNGWEKWYEGNKDLYADFMRRMEDLLTTLLQGDAIPYHSVGGRLKEKGSFMEKLERKGYEEPGQVMDLAGLRVITHTTSEVKRVCEVIEREFEVDAEHSGDKAKNLDVDKVGYLSVHYIVRMEPQRVKLPEYKRFKGLCCEIQVRSLLQHAWAEIEHDRSYKFFGVLPEEIKRKFYLVAGTLELMDQEFCSLVDEIDKYKAHVHEEAKKGNLNIPIDSASLLEFLSDFFEGQDTVSLGRTYQSGSEKVIAELHDFGVDTLEQLNGLLCGKTPSEWLAERSTRTYIGILRDAMMINDAKKYFRDAWKEHWVWCRSSSYEYLKANGVDLYELHDIITLTPPAEGSDKYFVKKASQPAERGSV